MKPAGAEIARRSSTICLFVLLLCGCASETRGGAEPVPALRIDLGPEADAELLRAARALVGTDAIDLATSAFRDDPVVTLERRPIARSIGGPVPEHGRRREAPLRLRLETTGDACRLSAPDLERWQPLTNVRCRRANAP